MIDIVAFGRIVIQGKEYTSDLKIFPDGKIADNWCRKSGHRIYVSDIQDLIETRPDIIIIGCGMDGRVVLQPEVEKTLNQNRIVFFAGTNSKAKEIFNQMWKEKKTAGGFHLTC